MMGALSSIGKMWINARRLRKKAIVIKSIIMIKGNLPMDRYHLYLWITKYRFLNMRIVQLQRLGARGHKVIQLRLLGTQAIRHPLKKAKSAFLQCASYVYVPEQSPPHLGQSVKNAKEQPSRRLVLCQSLLIKALPLLLLFLLSKSWIYYFMTILWIKAQTYCHRIMPHGIFYTWSWSQQTYTPFVWPWKISPIPFVRINRKMPYSRKCCKVFSFPSKNLIIKIDKCQSSRDWHLSIHQYIAKMYHT